MPENNKTKWIGWGIMVAVFSAIFIFLNPARKNTYQSANPDSAPPLPDFTNALSNNDADTIPAEAPDQAFNKYGSAADGLAQTDLANRMAQIDRDAQMRVRNANIFKFALKKDVTDYKFMTNAIQFYNDHKYLDETNFGKLLKQLCIENDKYFDEPGIDASSKTR